MTRYAITGANGTLGRATAEYVLASRSPDQLTLLSRRPDSLQEFADRGVDTRRADFDEPESLEDAMRGIDVLLLISTDAIGRRRPQHEAAISAAARAGIGRIVYTSTTDPHRDHPESLRPLTDDHAATEDALRQAGPSWTVLRNALYLDSLVPVWAQSVAAGQLVTNNGAGRHAPVARNDCAAAAAAVLIGDGHENGIYDITGPRLVDDVAVVGALSADHESPIDVVHVSDDDFAAGLAAAGMPPEVVPIFVGFGASIRAGLMETPIGDTQRLIGRPPLSLEDFLTHV